MNLSMEQIKQVVAVEFNIRIADLNSARRARDLARPRQAAMWLCKQRTNRTLPEIGKCFGNRDHTTVMHAVETIERLRKTNPDLDDRITACELKIDDMELDLLQHADFSAEFERQVDDYLERLRDLLLNTALRKPRTLLSVIKAMTKEISP